MEKMDRATTYSNPIYYTILTHSFTCFVGGLLSIIELHFYTQKVFETSVYLLLLAISEEEKKAADAHLEEEFRLHAYVKNGIINKRVLYWRRLQLSYKQRPVSIATTEEEKKMRA
jgi:hypothetical protein